MVYFWRTGIIELRLTEDHVRLHCWARGSLRNARLACIARTVNGFNLCHLARTGTKVTGAHARMR